MLVKEIPLTLLKVVKKEGVGKNSGKPYSFSVATVIDEESNVFQLNLHDSLHTQSGLTELRHASIVADIEFKPKGFDIAGTLTNFDVQ